MLILILSFFLQAMAAEIDSFTPRYSDIPEGLPLLSAEVDRRIRQAVESANKVSSCDTLMLTTYLALELMRPGYGKIEQFINNSPAVFKENIPFTMSVYQNVPQPHAFLFNIGEFLFPFGYVVREGRWIIGSDKFGHFMDEGYLFYLHLNKDGSNLDAVLNRSIWTEDTYNGLTFGGVKSFADLVANYYGMRFWSQLISSKFEGDKPYLGCDNGKWIMLRAFDWREYIDAGWDEGINCNEYKSIEYEQRVQSKIDDLELKTGKRHNCPIYPNDCVELQHKFGPIASKLLQKKCLEAKKEAMDS
jgi:hypothetical protein